jgi:hypothetical protein
MMKSYGPAINASIFDNTPDIGSGRGQAAQVSYINAALAAGPTIDGLTVDYYFGSYNNGVRIDGASSALSIAQANNLRMGVNEFGCHLTDNYQAYFTYLTNVAVEIQNSVGLLQFMYYDGICSATGTGDLASPIGFAANGNPFSPTSADPRVPYYQTMFDTIVSSIYHPHVTATDGNGNHGSAGFTWSVTS